MAQARVTEFFSTKKRNFDAQPSKRRKLAVAAVESEVFQTIERNTRSTRSSSKGVIPDVRPENVQQVRAPTPTLKAVQKPRAKSTRKKQVKIPKNQTTLQNAFDNSRSSTPESEIAKQSFEEVTSAWDEHDGPMTPSKRQSDVSSTDSEGEILSRKRRRRGAPKENVEETPSKAVPEYPTPRRSRKKLVMRSNVIQSSDSEDQEQQETTLIEKAEFREALSLAQTPPAISPLPDTPKNTRVKVKGPNEPTSLKVKTAMEQLKKLKSNPKDKQISHEEVKEKLSKCGKLEDLKAKLAEMQKTKSQLKKSLPKVPTSLVKLPDDANLNRIPEVKSEVQDLEVKSEEQVKKAPAYERFHTLASPAPPTLTLPYKYKMLAEMFRGMDTVVSMLHNRSEVCTFSKLKAAVQEMTKKNFEEKNVGQVKTVYPTAYSFRQEKGLPSFGKKVTGYELIVEPQLEMDPESCLRNKNGGPLFTAKHLIERRSTFHSKLIAVVKKYHKEFLASLSRPLSVPDDKITRWHPKFNVDEVPDIETDVLPQPPVVKKYNTARDVLEDNRGKILPRVEKALVSVAKTSDQPSPVKDKKPVSDLPQYKGVPQFLLDKIRAKEAQKQEEAMMRNPAEDKRTRMLNRLPDMMRIIRSHFVTEKKPALPLQNVVQKLADSYRTSIRTDEVEDHIKMMVDLTPEWLNIVKIKAGSFVKMDKNVDLQTLQDKISNIAKR